MTITLIISLVSFLFTNCNDSCTTENIDILGTWDVYKVEMIDSENKMRGFYESKGKNYDEYLEEIKILEDIEFTFKDNDTSFVRNPKELRGDGETPYSFKNGTDVISIGDREYGFEVKSCNEILISDFTSIESAKLIMYCRRK